MIVRGFLRATTIGVRGRLDLSCRPSIQRFTPRRYMATKRKAPSNGKPESKRPRVEVSEYCAAEPAGASDGGIIWPAPAEAIDAARAFLKDW